MSRRSLVRACLLVVAVLCFGGAGLRVVHDHRTKTRLRAELAAARAAVPERPRAAPGVPAGRPPEEGTLIGRIRVPRIDLDAMILEGVSDGSLRDGAGHFSETPLPGAGGNVALAGHRDTHFAPLERATVGDTIHVATAWGDFAYRMTGVEIVDPEDVWVLDQGVEDRLTLVTCHPFRWMGPAPRRIVIRAVPIGPHVEAARTAR